MATSLVSTQTEPPSEPPNKHFIDGALLTKHNAASIFQRRILFKESTKPDHKMDALKKKYRPINEITSPASAQSNGHDGDANGGKKPHQNKSANGTGTPLEDENGFRRPARVLFDRNQLIPTWRQVRPIGSGLHNLGFTCYLNSVLQCLSYTPALANYLLAGEHSRSCRSTGPCMFCEVEKHVQRTFSGGESGRAFSPKNLAGKLRLIGKTLRIGRQEDSHEFMMSLLDTMIRSLLANFNSKMDERIKETTVIHQIFGGHLLSQVKCLKCKRESNKFDGFTDLSLEIKNASSIEQAFKQFTRAEYLVKNNQYNCEKCKTYVDAQKQLTIYRPPLVLNIHLKRFEYANAGGSKLGKYVRFGETLDLREFVSPGRRGGVGLYRLYAVLVHQGNSCSSGHYYCFVRSSSGAWYCMDDESVTQVGLAKVLDKPAYMLFYTQEVLEGEEKELKREAGQQTVKRKREEVDGSAQSSKKARLDGSEAGQTSSYKARAQVQMQMQGQVKAQVQETKRKADGSASSEAQTNGLAWAQRRIRIEGNEGGQASDHKALAQGQAQAQMQVQGMKRKADGPASGETQTKRIMVDPAEGLEGEQAGNHKAQAQEQMQGTKRKTDRPASGDIQANGLAQEQKPFRVEGREVGEAVDRRTFAKERMHANGSANRHAPPVVYGHKPPAVNGDRPPVVNRHRPPADRPPVVNGHKPPAVNGHRSPAVNGHRSPAVNGDRPPAVNGDRPPAVNGHKLPAVNEDRPPAVNEHWSPAVNGDRPPAINGDRLPAINGDRLPAINGNKEKGLTPFKSPASKSASEDWKDATAVTILSKHPSLKLNSLLPTPSPSPSVDDARSPPPTTFARYDAAPVPVTAGLDRWVVSPVMEQKAPPHAQETVPFVLNNEEKWKVKSKGVEGKEIPPVEEGEAKSKPKLNVEGAVVVNYNDKMEAKRAKLDELVEREAAVGRSLEVKERILGVGMPKGQFGGSVDRWDGSSTDADRDAALRQASAPKSRVSQYDLDYDRGKVKKMKKKNKARWHVEDNMFQREANVQNAIKENRSKK